MYKATIEVGPPFDAGNGDREHCMRLLKINIVGAKFGTVSSWWMTAETLDDLLVALRQSLEKPPSA